MVSKTTPVNISGKDLATFGGRLVAERERLRFKQVDVCVIAGVSKTTQIKYESNERRPDADYLERLAMRGFDVSYLLTGDRSSESMSVELQNLVDAYEDAAPALREAAFAVLLSPLLQQVRKSRVVPGFARHELSGENDVRYEKWIQEQSGNVIHGDVGVITNGPATFSGPIIKKK